jgi:hypothetical protein
MSEKNAGKTGLFVSPLLESVFLFTSIDSGTSDKYLFSFSRMDIADGDGNELFCDASRRMVRRLLKGTLFCSGASERD